MVKIVARGEPRTSNDRSAYSDPTDWTPWFPVRTRPLPVAQGAPGDPLTAVFNNVPATHDGESMFPMQIEFSAALTTGWKALRDSITVTDGKITRINRVNGLSHLWNIEITPSSDDNISITLAASGPCDGDAAVCADDQVLEDSSATQVYGPIPPTTITSAEITSDAGKNGTWDEGESVTVDVTFSAGVTAQGTPKIGITVDSTSRQATYSSDVSATTIRFTYAITADDAGATTVLLVANSIDTATGSIGDNLGADTVLDFEVEEETAGDKSNAPDEDNTAATGVPTISGTATTGNTLTAVTSAITDTDGMDDATFSYQWLRNNVAISGATSSTYVLVSADEDNTIKVRVSFTDDEGNAETLTSAGTTATATAPTNSAATGQPTLTGTTMVSSVLTAATSGISDANGLDSASFSYQWLRDDANISDATSSTYTVAGEDEDHTIKVQVSFTDDDDFTESVTSAGTAIPLVPLTGHLANVPASHGGLNTTITFQLYFSVNPSLGFTNVRDNVLDVTNGTVTYVRRTDPQGSARNSRWEITVQPTGTSAVSVALSPTTDCSADSAVCTTWGKMLSNDASITIAGP